MLARGSPFRFGLMSLCLALLVMLAAVPLIASPTRTPIESFTAEPYAPAFNVAALLTIDGYHVSMIRPSYDLEHSRWRLDTVRSVLTVPNAEPHTRAADAIALRPERLVKHVTGSIGRT